MNNATNTTKSAAPAQPRFVRIERMPDGSKRLCVAGRWHGKKLVQRLTWDDLKRLFETG